MKILEIKDLGIVTTKSKINKKYIDTVLWLENGKKFPYREQYVLDDFTGNKRLEIMPKASRKIVYLLNYIGCSDAVKIEKDQKTNRKTAILTIKLNKKQQEKLNELKSLCT